MSQQAYPMRPSILLFLLSNNVTRCERLLICHGPSYGSYEGELSEILRELQSCVADLREIMSSKISFSRGEERQCGNEDKAMSNIKYSSRFYY
jgi:hypothetical protein